MLSPSKLLSTFFHLWLDGVVIARMIRRPARGWTSEWVIHLNWYDGPNMITETMWQRGWNISVRLSRDVRVVTSRVSRPVEQRSYVIRVRLFSSFRSSIWIYVGKLHVPILSSYYKAAKDGCRQIRTLFTFVLYLLGRFWTDSNEIDP